LHNILGIKWDRVEWGQLSMLKHFSQLKFNSIEHIVVLHFVWIFLSTEFTAKFMSFYKSFITKSIGVNGCCWRLENYLPPESWFFAIFLWTEFNSNFMSFCRVKLSPWALDVLLTEVGERPP